MQILTTARHCEIDPELRLFAQQRLEKLGRFARDIHEAHLVMTAEGYRHSAEITLRLNHHELVSREESTEPRVAIDRAADRLEQTLRRFKEKRADRKHDARGADRGKPAAGGGETPVSDEPAADDEPLGED